MRFLIALFIATNAFAYDATDPHELNIGEGYVTPQVQKGAGRPPMSAQIFVANGSHRCWSNELIGYSCSVSGRDFMDCDQARVTLSLADCCNNFVWQGNRVTGARSIEFTLGHCSKFW